MLGPRQVRYPTHSTDICQVRSVCFQLLAALASGHWSVRFKSITLRYDCGE